MKTWILTAFGAIGAFLTGLLGGWDLGIETLLILMCIDYITGVIVAGVFHKSGKSDSGRLESGAGWKGLLRKFAILLVVIVGYRIDLMLSTDYLRDGFCLAFSLNEALSIVENLGLMGVPMPEKIKNALEALKKKNE
jgi:toxin secretion/phage lysis holin